MWTHEFGRMFDDLVWFGRVMFCVALVTVPLALWKAIEIIVWIAKHLKIGWD